MLYKKLLCLNEVFASPTSIKRLRFDNVKRQMKKDGNAAGSANHWRVKLLAGEADSTAGPVQGSNLSYSHPASVGSWDWSNSEPLECGNMY